MRRLVACVTDLAESVKYSTLTCAFGIINFGKFLKNNTKYAIEEKYVNNKYTMIYEMRYLRRQFWESMRVFTS